jgi:hypothetical protein
MKPQKTPFFLSVIPGVTFVLVLLWHSSANQWGNRRFTLFDDAMISMDYARTLAETGQFVWFPGAPRVEGFTNPLWTLWMALIHLVGFEGSSAALAVALTGVLLIIGSAWIVYDLVARSTEQHSIISASLASASVFFMFPMVYWTLRGMEVGVLAFFTLLLMRGVLVQASKDDTKFSIAIALPALLGIATRFDFIVVCLVAIFALTLWTPNEKRIRLFGTYGTYILLCLVALCSFQKWYWNSWLPNTYHLKIDGVDLIDRVSRGIVAGSKASVLAIILIFAFIISRSLATSARRLVQLSVAMFFAISAYAVYIGGDAWEDQMLNRFFATALPLVSIAVTVGFSKSMLCGRVRYLLPLLLIASVGYGATVNPFGIAHRDLAMGCAITLVGSCIILLATQTERTSHYLSPSLAILITVITAISGIPLQRQIRNHNVLGASMNVYVTEVVENLAPTTKPQAVIATVWAGVPAYYTRRPMIDLLGKNDTRIGESTPHGEFFPGHNKWDYDYSIGQLRPDVIFQTFTRGLEKDLPRRIEAWGYKKFCVSARPFPPTGVYYRTDSMRINWNLLTPCSS